MITIEEIAAGIEGVGRQLRAYLEQEGQKVLKKAMEENPVIRVDDRLRDVVEEMMGNRVYPSEWEVKRNEFEDRVREIFGGSPKVRIEVWEFALAMERMLKEKESEKRDWRVFEREEGGGEVRLYLAREMVSQAVDVRVAVGVDQDSRRAMRSAVHVGNYAMMVHDLLVHPVEE